MAFGLLAAVALQGGWDQRLLPLAEARIPGSLRHEMFLCGAIDLMDRQSELVARFDRVKQRIRTAKGNVDLNRFMPPSTVIVDPIGRAKCLTRTEITRRLDQGESAIAKLERSFPPRTPRKRN